jgi:hypothetical protein
MPTKTLIVLVCVLIAFLIAFAIVLLRETEVTVKRRRRGKPITRSLKTPIRIMELVPSGGYAWSAVRYPLQYATENMNTTILTGLPYIENERYLDIAGRAYSRAVLEKFSYTGEFGTMPEVKIEYPKNAETFVCKVTASGLKPNFAYQLKLRGRYSDDPVGFMNIGYTGRWRLPGRGTNYNDKVIEKYEHLDEVESYLFFDFFVTDDKGEVEQWCYADSSLHVLWNATTQRPSRPADGAQRPILRRGGDRTIYANPRGDVSAQRMYAESEQHSQGTKDNRPEIGKALLPTGDYKAEIVLTEESFHGWGDNGFWPTVMAGRVEFAVNDNPHPPTGASLDGAGEQAISLDAVECVAINVSAQSETALQGEAMDVDPQIISQAWIECAPGERYVLSVDIYGKGKHTWQLYLRWFGEEFERRPVRSFTTGGKEGWQRFEVEITSLVAGQKTQLRIDPRTGKGPIGVRNLRLLRLQPPPPVLPMPEKVEVEEKPLDAATE